MNARRPPSGSSVLWRPNGSIEYRYGYCTYERSYNIVRLGRWVGDTVGGSVADIADIDWMPR